MSPLDGQRFNLSMPCLGRVTERDIIRGFAGLGGKSGGIPR